MWTTYGRFLLKHRGPDAAAEALNRALDLNPIDPQINYDLARVLEQRPASDDREIRRAYNLAIAEPVRGRLSELDFAIYLHRSGQYDEANQHFSALRGWDIPNRLKTRPRTWLRDDAGRQRFVGQLTQVGHAKSYLRLVNFPDTVFVSSFELPNEIKLVGAEVEVFLFYNCLGLRARPVTFDEGLSAT
jgi:hypothetical protein